MLQDIENIITDKLTLGLLSDIEIPGTFGQSGPELIFVFHPDDILEIEVFKEELQNRSKSIVVSDNDYKLK